MTKSIYLLNSGNNFQDRKDDEKEQDKLTTYYI